MSNHDGKGWGPSNRDDDLAGAWREASDEQPPSHLDDAIIAAARKSIPVHGERPNAAPVRVQSRNWLLQWQPLAAAAAIAGLAFVLVQVLPRERDFAPSMQQTKSAPIPAPVESPPRSTSVPAAMDNSPLANTEKAVAQPEPDVVPDRAPAQGAVPAPPAVTAEATVSEAPATAEAAAAPGEAVAVRREAMEPAIAGRAVAAAADASSSSARQKNLREAVPLEATAWSAKVVALHASGDVTAAADALRAFRAVYPGADAYLPDSLRDWARTVER